LGERKIIPGRRKAFVEENTKKNRRMAKGKTNHEKDSLPQEKELQKLGGEAIGRKKR